MVIVFVICCWTLRRYPSATLPTFHWGLGDKYGLPLFILDSFHCVRKSLPATALGFVVFRFPIQAAKECFWNLVRLSPKVKLLLLSVHLFFSCKLSAPFHFLCSMKSKFKLPRDRAQCVLCIPLGPLPCKAYLSTLIVLVYILCAVYQTETSDYRRK